MPKANLYMRKSFVHIYENALITNPKYPVCRINNMNKYDEQIMSMPSIINSNKLESIDTTCNECIKKGTYFFFIFNFENYYHFLYDTLPYLYHYYNIKEADNTCKLLLPENHNFLQFQRDIFNLLHLTQYEIAVNNTKYEKVYMPSSLTHGKLENMESASNYEPSLSAFTIWNKLSYSIKCINNTPKKLYISRRTWIHNNLENIGTNYTSRRKCVNEDELVDLVKKYGYQEVFCENLSMSEKIEYFKNATHVLGLIGGGMANLLFSNKDTITGCIVTPDFLNINNRFIHSMDHTNITYLNITKHIPYEGKYPLYSRIKVIDISHDLYDKIGEIDKYQDNMYIIKMSNNDVAGFSMNSKFNSYKFSEKQIVSIDNGLNSPFECDLNSLRNYLNTYIK